MTTIQQGASFIRESQSTRERGGVRSVSPQRERAAARCVRACEHALGNIAVSDFSIKYSVAQELRNYRYYLRNLARELAKSVPALAATRRQKARLAKAAEIRAEGRLNAAQREGKLFADSLTTEKKDMTFKAHRMAYCGASAADSRLPVFFRENATSAGITNLQTCGSYACPVCAAKVGNRRFEEVVQVLGAAREAGYAVSMVTLTMRHKHFDRLDDLWDALAAGWRVFSTSPEWTGESVEYYAQAREKYERRGWLSDDYKEARAEYELLNPGEKYPGRPCRAPRGWKDSKDFRPRRVGLSESLGVLGTIRSVEVTLGANGWHPHIHAVIVHKAGKDEVDSLLKAQKIGLFIHSQWVKGLEKYGFESLAESGGLDVSLMTSSDEDIASYATKITRTSGLDRGTEKISYEVTRADLKKGRAGGLTPLQLLESAVEGEVEAVQKWREFAIASQGRRWVVISPDLRKFGKLGEEKTDEEIAEETVEAVPVAQVEYRDWKEHKLWLVASQLLAVLEQRGAVALFARLEELGVPYEDVRGMAIEKPPLKE